MTIGSFDAGNINEVEIEIDAMAIGQFLAKDPAFIQAISLIVRDQMTKDARIMGNLFGQWAQANAPTAANTTKRLT
jgi:hypothetical protein